MAVQGHLQTLWQRSYIGPTGCIPNLHQQTAASCCAQPHLFMLLHEVLDVRIFALLHLMDVLLAPQLCVLTQRLQGDMNRRSDSLHRAGSASASPSSATHLSPLCVPMHSFLKTWQTTAQPQSAASGVVVLLPMGAATVQPSRKQST